MLKLEKHIEIVPETPRIQLVDYLRRAEIFVATPTQEGLGISILEAMSCGLPVVITSCGGPATLIQKSGGGLITKANKKDFSDSVIKLLANKNLSTTLGLMGLRGRKYIQKHLSFSTEEEKLRQELDKQYAKQ